MKQFETSLSKPKRSSRLKGTKTGLNYKYLFTLPIEWKLLFALLVLMSLRLAMIVVFVMKQF